MPQEIRLSASRLESLKNCSWSFYCKEVLRLPDSGNDGTKRGTICHELLEHLVKPKHRALYLGLKKSRNPWACPVCKRFLELWAKKVDLDLDQEVVNDRKSAFVTHREVVGKMLMVALDNDFSPDDAVKIEPEKKVRFDVNENGVRYVLTGVIDKIIFYADRLKIQDYKTSKQKFDSEKIDLNLQGLIYQFMCRKLYPEYKDLEFEFIFLKFPKNPIITLKAFKEEFIAGFEHYLTYIYNYISSFDEKKARSNLGRFNGNNYLCGKGGCKSLVNYRTGVRIPTKEPNWKCPFKDPFHYWALINEDGLVKETALEIENLSIPTEKQKVEKRYYQGCVAFYAHKKELEQAWKVLS